MTDTAIIHKCFAEEWILITADKDFGGMIYRDEYPHRGVILLRLEDERAPVKISVMQRLLDRYHDRLLDRYIVVTENRVRFSER